MGRPDIVVTRMIEEDDVVVAEGSVRTQKRDGGALSLRFCDVFVMQAGKIRRLTAARRLPSGVPSASAVTLLCSLT